MAKAPNKTTENDASVDDFLSSTVYGKVKTDSYIIKELRSELTNEPAKKWEGSIVDFGTYHYKYDSGREGDFLKIEFSPRAQNLSLYITPRFERYNAYMYELEKYKSGKSYLNIKKLGDIDLKKIQKLIIDSFDYITYKYG